MSNYRKPKPYNINDIITWHNNRELNFSPKYQRNPIWNIKAKSYLIDSILRGLPIPPLFMKEHIDVNLNKTMREIIDGQQRIRTIIEYRNDDFKILKEHNEYYKNLKYSELPSEKKKDFLGFEMSFEIVTTNEESIIYDMFARLNTNNKALNSQELRNAKYWGDFKVLSYKLAKDTKQLFIDLKTFSYSQFARMLDVEFVSSLLIICIDGLITESTKVINDYYQRYDNDFKDMQNIEKQFNNVIIDIYTIFFDYNYNSSYFYRKVFFYTLFAFLYHSRYGLKNSKEKRYSKLSDERIVYKFIDKLSSFEIDLQEANLKNKKISNYKEFTDFIKFHERHTTNLTERINRFKIFNDYMTK